MAAPSFQKQLATKLCVEHAFYISITTSKVNFEVMTGILMVVNSMHARKMIVTCSAVIA